MHLDDLACKTACHDVLVRFCTALDTCDNVAAADLFADDAQMVAPSGDTVHGTAIRAYFERRPTALITRHIMTNVLVEPTGPDTASARAPTSLSIACSDKTPIVCLARCPAARKARGTGWSTCAEPTPDGG